ncbi:MAG TPA: FMN-dependent NADH-azoreductase [Solirubrobacterales bacterium]|nr:FMN-dependent NADH-azoreductase [Solirubrobacterales bacterium]
MSAQAAARWREANPDGTVTHRDLAADPLPHLGPAGVQARAVPPEQHNAEQAASWALSVVGGLSMDAATGEPLLDVPEMIGLEARGGGYGEGTPREGWDHAQQWLPQGLGLTGLEPRFITAELTLADVQPAMADLRELAAASLKAAEEEVDALWTASAVA